MKKQHNQISDNLSQVPHAIVHVIHSVCVFMSFEAKCLTFILYKGSM